MAADEEHVFKSPVELREPPQDTNLARELHHSFQRHANRTLIVDHVSGRQWRGSDILACCGRIATCLVQQVGVKVNDVVMTICDREDSELLATFGIWLAGASIFPTTPTDGFNEAQLLCELVRPQVMLINRRHLATARRLCREVAGMSETRIVLVEGFDGPAGGGGERQADENNNTNSEADFAKRHEDEARPSLEIRLAELAKTHTFDERLIESIVNEKICSAEHIATFLLTSGSTGRPKVVPASHSELVACVYCMISATANPLPPEDSSGGCATTVDGNNNVDQPGTKPDFLLAVGQDDVFAGDLPLDHGAGLNVMLLSLWLGAKYIVMPSFNARLFWQAVHDHRISFSLSSTAFGFQLFSMLKDEHLLLTGRAGSGDTPEANGRRPSLSRLDLSSLRTIYVCGAKLGFGDLVDQVRRRLEHLNIAQSYGCTEIGYISTPTRRDAVEHRDSVGYLMPGIRAKIVDRNTGRALGPNERGELLVWSRALFKGYRCHPEVDADEIFRLCHDERGEFYRTGDQAHFDSAGRLYVHGRYKDTLVLMGDWKIMPAELEAVVDAHPLVEGSAVVGVPDPELPTCHKPRAFVKLVPTGALGAPAPGQSGPIGEELASRFQAGDLDFVAEHIRQFVADRVAPLKQLTGGVRILEEFPRNGLLRKIDRKALREM